MTTRFLSNVFLAVVWIFLTENYSFTNGLIGLGLGFVAIILSNRVRDSANYFNDLKNCVHLLALFIVQLVQTNAVLAFDILFRPKKFRHAFLAIDVRSLTRRRKILLSYMISLTPGTLILKYGEGDETIYIHSLYGDDNEGVLNQIEAFTVRLKAIG